MSLKIVLVLLSFAGVLGIIFGYFLRWIISLGKKGSMELEIKQMMLEAKEDAKRITSSAEQKAKETLQELKIELKKKEDQAQKNEDRLIKKEEFLDKRQVDIDKEVENIKKKIEEVRSVKERVDEMDATKKAELEKIAKLTTEQAKEELKALTPSNYIGNAVAQAKAIRD